VAQIFKGLDRKEMEKCNKLIMAINEKDELIGIIFLMLELLLCLMLIKAIHQMVHICHFTLLMHLMCFHANMAKLLPNMLGPNTRTPNLVFGYQRCLLLM
jgi:hypothetical protein